MPISFQCPHCGHAGVAEDQFAGQTGPCAACGQMLTIPAAEGAAMSAGNYAPPPPAKKSSAAIIIIALAGVAVVALCCVGILLALLLPAVQAAREAARRNSCSANLKQVSIAMLLYHDVHDSFPPAYTVDENGQRLHSWRTLLLPYMEQNMLYEQLDLSEPWDSDHNRQFHDRVIQVYRCPSSSGTDMTMTSYMVVVGAETAFPPDGETTAISDFQDGASATILIVETSDEATHWMEPTDIEFDQLNFQINVGPGEIGSEHPGLAVTARADASVHTLSEDIDPQVLKGMLTPNGGEVLTFE